MVQQGDEKVKFNIDINREVTGKVRGSHYALNMGFKTEQITQKEFLQTIKDGNPYTMAHHKRSPEQTGADGRNIKTPKHLENFMERSEITLDDDSEDDSVLTFWENDAFFQQYGFCFAESSSSKPAEQRGHVVFLLDRPLLTAAAVKEVYKAFKFMYSRLDPLNNADRTLFNSTGCSVLEVGETLPYTVLEEKVLAPYRKSLEPVQASSEPLTDDVLQCVVSNWGARVANFARAGSGEETTRHARLLGLGCRWGSLLKSDWATAVVESIGNPITSVLAAARTNGYYTDYAKSDDEVERIFNDGISHPNAVPLPYPEIVRKTREDRLNGETEALTAENDELSTVFVNKKGRVIIRRLNNEIFRCINATAPDYAAAITAVGYSFRTNLINDSILVTKDGLESELTDTDMAVIRNRVNALGLHSRNVMQDVVTGMAAENRFHPLKEYFENLEWNGEDHFAALMDKIDHTSEMPEIFWRKWLLGSVSKVYTQSQNYMLVLLGGQGTGKSQLVNWLCPLKELLHVGAIRPDDKDSMKQLMHNFIWEVDELDSTTRRADIAALKSFITVERIAVRFAYDRYDTKKPPMSSLIGTVNPEGKGFLSDQSGNRRFGVVEIDTIDWDYKSEIDVNQLWAQLYTAYLSGEEHNLTAVEQKVQNSANKTHTETPPIVDFLEAGYDFDAAPDAFISIPDFLTQLADAGLRSQQYRMKSDLQNFMLGKGIKRGRKRGVNGRFVGYHGVKKLENKEFTGF